MALSSDAEAVQEGAVEGSTDLVPSEVTDDQNTLPAVVEPETAMAGLAGGGLTGGPLGIPTRDELNDLLRFGKLLMASGVFQDLKGAAQAAVKVIAGRSFGLDPIQSQHAFSIINGQLSQRAKFQSALIKRSRAYDYRVVKLDENVCEMEWLHKRDGEWQVCGTSSFSKEDAARAGLGKSQSGRAGAWQMYPRSMLFARALTQGATWFCPHLLMGPGFAGDDLDTCGEVED